MNKILYTIIIILSLTVSGLGTYIGIINGKIVLQDRPKAIYESIFDPLPVIHDTVIVQDPEIAMEIDKLKNQVKKIKNIKTVIHKSDSIYIFTNRPDSIK